MQEYVDPTKEAFAKFRADDRPGPIHMLNLIKLRPQATYPDGRQATGMQAYLRYGQDSAPALAKAGGKIVWRGTFEMVVIGPDSEGWDVCFIAEYPSVQAFVDMVRDPIYREAVKHRQAAVKDSRLVRFAAAVPGNAFSD